ncbi:probable membrane-associated kinase regulator 1 [Punica granatum]|nr:probable membrane-associated kinase regulator 1 [Punica granatum]
MGRSTRSGHHYRSSQTLPSSPTHSLSSSSSDFEFTVSISPRKSSAALCPADELFYKGQLLPLQLSPRLSMVRTLLLSSPSSSGTATDSSRDSSGSSSDFSSCCDSSRPSSAADPYDEELKRLTVNSNHPHHHQIRGKSETSGKYFSLPKLSSVFRKDANAKSRELSSVKRMSASAKEVFRRYLKKVKPLYEKLSTKQQQQQQRMGKMTSVPSKLDDAIIRSATSLGHEASPAAPGKGGSARRDVGGSMFDHSFSGNLRYPRIGGSSSKRINACAASSCPSSMRSSPSHSGVLGRGGYPGPARTGSGGGAGYFYGDSVASTMEELQSAIQGAITHCKNSMMQQQQQSTSKQRDPGQSSKFGLNVI